MEGDQAFRALQVSNLWLDCKRLDSLDYPPELKRQRAEEIAVSFERMLLTAIEHGIDAVFIVGNLWDGAIASSATVARIVRLFNKFQELPFYIIPGSDDAFSLDTPYCGEFLKSIGLPDFGLNVHIFSSAKFSSVRHPYRREVIMTARSFPRGRLPSEWSLSSQTLLSEQDLNILLFTEPVDGLLDQDSYAGLLERYGQPCTQVDLVQLGFDYVGLGFGTQMSEVRNADNELIGVLSGSAFAQGLSDFGNPSAQIVTIEKFEGKTSCSYELIACDSRKLHITGADLSGLDLKDALNEIVQNLEDEGATKGQDIVYIELEGRHSAKEDPRDLVENLRRQFFHVFVVDRTRPDYLSQTFPPESSEKRFVEAMLLLKRDPGELANILTTIDAGDDKSRIVEDALYFGLDALQQRRVNLRNAD